MTVEEEETSEVSVGAGEMARGRLAGGMAKPGKVMAARGFWTRAAAAAAAAAAAGADEARASAVEREVTAEAAAAAAA